MWVSKQYIIYQQNDALSTEYHSDKAKASGLRINSTKTEVYVVTDALKDRCFEITKEIGLKNTISRSQSQAACFGKQRTTQVTT